jgi:hypothetical protein
MRRVPVLVLLLATTTLCISAHAADAPKLTIVLDHAKLTKWVLEDFADGLPFDKTGKPTDDEKAKQFWELIADWPVNVAGEVTGLAPAMSQICDEAGLPLYFTPVALEALEKAGTEMRLVTISDSVRKAVVIIGRLGGVEKTMVMPFGLVVLGPGEGKDIKQLVAAPPRLMFRWRANYAALLEKAFPDGLNREEATDDDLKKVVQIATGIRCDLIVPGEVELEKFLKWFVTASQQTFTTDQALFESADGVKRKVGPVECRFTLFLDAVNAVLEGTGLEARPADTHFVIAPAEPKNTFRWRDDYWARIHEELGKDWDWQQASDEERQRVCEIVAETRCDLILAEPMALRDFLSWVARSSDMNIVVHPAAFQVGSTSSDTGPIVGDFEPPADDQEPPVEETATVEDEVFEPTDEALPPPDAEAFPIASEDPRKVQPIVVQNVTAADAITAALEPLGLMAVPGGNGGLLIVPKGLSQEQLEELVAGYAQMLRSDADSSHEEEDRQD